jgi:uracil-DNA glycosylase family 4
LTPFIINSGLGAGDLDNFDAVVILTDFLSTKGLHRRTKFWMIVTMIQPALDLVIATLETIRETNDRAPRASKEVLARLQHVAPDKTKILTAVRERVRSCTKCAHLASSRTQTVFGVGNPNAEIMFIGEAPGADEDQQGEPFVGRAGQLLTKIIKAMGFAREDVYIANILKCRPDMPAGSFGNRAPTPSEMQTCRPYLLEQIDIIQPKVLVALGAVAVEGLLGSRGAMRELRGRWHSYNGTPLMITYHPAYLLRNQSPSEKRKVWEDMLQVLERLEKPISERQLNYFL